MILLSLAIPLILMFSGSVFCAVFLKKQFEESMPVSIMSIVTILYFFYCFNCLKIGYYIVVVLCVLSYFSLLYLLYKQGIKETYRYIYKYLITPGFCVFLILCFIFYIVTRENIVCLLDELRLWAAYPKILFFTDALQLGDDALLYQYMKSYPPGMPLFVYFFEKAGGIFSEAHIFFAYAIFGASIFLPALKKVTWKQAWAVLPLSLAIFFIPLFFYNSYNDLGDYYKSLYIDPVLGMMLAYDIYLITKNCFSTSFNTYRFTIALIVTILIKDTGTMFAIISFIGAIVLEFTVFKNISKSKEKESNDNEKLKIFIRILFAFILPVISIILWKYLLSIYEIHNHLNFNISFLSNDFDFVELFIENLKRNIIVISNFPKINKHLTFSKFMLFFILINIFILKCTKKRKTLSISFIFLYIANLFFIIGLYILCLVVFNKQFASFNRYIGTILLADVILFFLVFIDNADAIFNKMRYNKFTSIIASVIVVIFVLIFPFREPKVCNYNLHIDALQHENIIYSCINDDKSSNNQNDIKNVYIVFSEDMYRTAGIHHKIYFDFLGDKILIKNFYIETDIVNRGSQSRKDIEIWVNQFKNTLINGDFDYVYIAEDDPKLKEQFKTLMGNDIHAGSMYKVKISNNNVFLEKINC